MPTGFSLNQQSSFSTKWTIVWKGKNKFIVPTYFRHGRGYRGFFPGHRNRKSEMERKETFLKQMTAVSAFLQQLKNDATPSRLLNEIFSTICCSFFLSVKSKLIWWWRRWRWRRHRRRRQESKIRSRWRPIAFFLSIGKPTRRIITAHYTWRRSAAGHKNWLWMLPLHRPSGNPAWPFRWTWWRLHR